MSCIRSTTREQHDDTCTYGRTLFLDGWPDLLSRPFYIRYLVGRYTWGPQGLWERAIVRMHVLLGWP